MSISCASLGISPVCEACADSKLGICWITFYHGDLNSWISGIQKEEHYDSTSFFEYLTSRARNHQYLRQTIEFCFPDWLSKYDAAMLLT